MAPTSGTATPSPIQRQILMAGIGECLMMWAFVEHRLTYLFSSRLKSLPPRLAWTMWDGVISFDAKLSLLNKVMGQTLQDKELIAIWNRLSVKIGKKSKKRNEIAHGSVIMGRSGDTYLVPYGSLGAITNPKTPKLTEKELLERRQSFSAVFQAVAWFSEAIAIREDNAAAVLPLAPDLVREIQTSISQNPKGT